MDHDLIFCLGDVIDDKSHLSKPTLIYEWERHPSGKKADRSISHLINDAVPRFQKQILVKVREFRRF